MDIFFDEANGDIRNAINTLQVTLNNKKKGLESIEGRDVSLSIYHAVGKVMYNHRMYRVSTHIRIGRSRYFFEEGRER